MDTKSQQKAILEYLQAGNTITALEALRLFGSLRLGGRIFDLRAEGYPIQSETIVLEGNKRVSRYWLQRETLFEL